MPSGCAAKAAAMRGIMPNPPRITLITASFNRAHMIGDMMSSVAAQAFPPVQHLVMDGCSSDGTVELLKAYPSVELHVAKDNGVYDAWNKARPLIRGDWVIYLNTDDLLADGAFAAYADALTCAPHARIVTGGAAMQDIHDAASATTREEPAAVALTLANLRLNGCILNARLIQSDLIKTVGDFDRSLHPASDLDFMIRLARLKPESAYVNSLTYVYRRHEGSITLGRSAHGNYRTPSIGLNLLDHQLDDKLLSSAERVNIKRWRISYMDALLAADRLRSDPRGWARSLVKCAVRQPAGTAKCLTGKLINKSSRMGRRENS